MQSGDMVFIVVVVVGVGFCVFFVFLVCGYVQFGVFMYLLGVDLNFYCFVVWFQYYGMNRLVIVGFWVGYVVVEFIWQMVVVSMDDFQCGIVIL